MKVFFRSLLRFIKGTIHYRLFHRGPGDFSRKADVISIHSYRFGALPGRRRYGMKKRTTPSKVVALPQAIRTASSN